jgi:hypothetical protein
MGSLMVEGAASPASSNSNTLWFTLSLSRYTWLFKFWWRCWCMLCRYTWLFEFWWRCWCMLCAGCPRPPPSTATWDRTSEIALLVATRVMRSSCLRWGNNLVNRVEGGVGEDQEGSLRTAHHDAVRIMSRVSSPEIQVKLCPWLLFYISCSTVSVTHKYTWRQHHLSERYRTIAHGSNLILNDIDILE